MAGMNRTEMKNQTIGVEVEMNNITRKSAAKLAADVFKTSRYKDTHVENGYSSWSAWDAQGREWKFQKDVSIHGADSKKCELVTPILHYDDIELLQELIRALRKAGAKSDATRGCGVHIHIGVGNHTAQSLRNLANIMAGHEEILSRSLNIDSDRIGSYCRTVDPRFLKALNSKKPETLDKLADVWYESQFETSGRTQHYNHSRYHMLNLHATFTKGTIEFRLFQFDAPADGKQNGLHAGQLKAYIQLCLAMSNLAKSVKSVKTNVSLAAQAENPKAAMNAWMRHLGFVGEEFATARKLLTKRLVDTAAVA